MFSFSLGDEIVGVVQQNQALAKLQDRVATLFEESRDDVYRYLLTLGLHPPQAQEVTQEVFLRLYSAMRKGEEIQNPRAWVFKVAHNYGLKVRARQNTELAFDPEVELNIPAGEKDPEHILLERERWLRFHQAVEGLSEQQRRCLHLRMEGLRYPEIGSILGISPSAVGEFLRRAMVRLRNVRE